MFYFLIFNHLTAALTAGHKRSRAGLSQVLHKPGAALSWALEVLQ